MAILNIMYGIDVTAWNENELEKLEMGQNKVARIALNVPRYAVIEELRGDMGMEHLQKNI
ncbi:hypothetical protein E2C01_085513 [Portunus trituberculatus]|uniref:Uncharacterized protein n=1 Tax=Portunus trituberculatus TaxID=210409 RepID=A0A5B7J2X4_PORTR|nr:hypothetical protein [Portunus trituberculatus]